MAVHALAASAHLSELSGQQFRRRSTAAVPAFMARNDKPKIDITLDDHQAGSFVPSYTSLDRIKGTATITSPIDTRYDSIHILLQGTSRTFVERFLSANSPTIPRTNAYQQFLRLVQPAVDLELPQDRILRAGQSYPLKFLFVVPDKLLPMACRHATEADIVTENHLQLPPSLGDPMMSSSSEGVLLDDLAPPASVISYSLRVVIVKRESAESANPGKSQVINDVMKKLRICPATEEAPPLSVESGTDDYYLERRKSLKKGMFKGKMGTLLAKASQPSPIRLPYIRGDACSDSHSSTMIGIDLRFLPTLEASNPPKINYCFIRLKVGTFFSTKPMPMLPGKAPSFAYDSSRGSLVDTVHLSSRRLGSVAWEKHDEKPSDPEAVVDAFYTAHVMVPIELPKTDKTFVPTFHCCLVSRVYALDISLSAKSAFGSSATIHLKVPVQIIQEGNPNPEPLISPSEASAIRQREEILGELMRRASQAPGSPGRNASVSSMRTNSITGGSLNPRYTVGGEDDVPGMADLALRGARGSVWSNHEVRPPRTIAENPDTNGNGLGIDGANGTEDTIEEQEDLDDEPESRAAIAAALAADADDIQASFTNRARGMDEPPEYTPTNGIINRVRGTNMWT